MEGKPAGLTLRMRPHHAIFAVTERCNAKCVHCSIDAGSPLRAPELNTRTVVDILEQIADIGVFFVGLSGGEVLLREDVYELVSESAKRLFTSIATNGLLLTDRVVVRLKEAGLHGLLVSMDHVQAPVHDEIRGVPGLFAAARKGVEEAIQAGIDVVLGFTPMRKNHDVLREVAELAARLGCSGLNISQFMPTGRGGREMDLTPSEWGNLTGQVISLMDEYGSAMRVQYHDPRLVASLRKPDASPLSGCQAGLSHFYVLPNGDVTPCNMITGLRLGNLVEQPLQSIIGSYQATSPLQDRSRLRGRCALCAHKVACGGCRATAMLYTGDPHASDPRCWMPKLSLE